MYLCIYSSYFLTLSKCILILNSSLESSIHNGKCYSCTSWCSAGLLAGLWEFPSKPLSVESPGLPYPDVLQDHGVQVLYASKKVNCGEVCALNYQ